MMASVFLLFLDRRVLDIRSLDLQSLAQLTSARMLNSTAEGIGIALLAWILLGALGRQNSGTRFAVWFSALIGIGALSLFGHFGSRGAAIANRSEITIPGSWAIYIFFVWAIAASAGLARVGLGLWRLRQLRRSCSRVDVATLDPLLRKTLRESDSSRSVTVCASERLRVPAVVGFFKPLIVIPYWTMRDLSAAELNAVLLHELAHLRRWDDWTNLIQKILSALLFFHPAVWWLERKLALEREMACDDMVLAEAASPRVYAECLVSLAEKNLLRRGFALAQSAVGRMRHISLRVARILDEPRPGATRVWKPALVLLTVASIACLMAFSGAPRLVSFSDGPARSAAAGPVTENLSEVTKVNGFRTVISETNPVANADLRAAALHIVPAKFVVRTLAKTPTPVAAKAKSKTSRSSLVFAKTRQQTILPPMLVRGSMEEEDISHQTLVFFIRTEFIRTEVIQTEVVETDDPEIECTQTWEIRTEQMQTKFRTNQQDHYPGVVVWPCFVWQVNSDGSAQVRWERVIAVRRI